MGKLDDNQKYNSSYGPPGIYITGQWVGKSNHSLHPVFMEVSCDCHTHKHRWFKERSLLQRLMLFFIPVKKKPKKPKCRFSVSLESKSAVARCSTVTVRVFNSSSSSNSSSSISSCSSNSSSSWV